MEGLALQTLSEADACTTSFELAGTVTEPYHLFGTPMGHRHDPLPMGAKQHSYTEIVGQALAKSLKPLESHALQNNIFCILFFSMTFVLVGLQLLVILL